MPEDRNHHWLIIPFEDYLSYKFKLTPEQINTFFKDENNNQVRRLIQAVNQKYAEIIQSNSLDNAKDDRLEAEIKPLLAQIIKRGRVGSDIPN